MKNRLLLVVAFLISSHALTQENRVVEKLDSIFIDTKTNLPRKNSGKIVSKIDSDVLEQSIGKSVAEIINRVSGIEITGSRSNAGQNLGYVARGGRNRQVVIMVDGVQLNDPSQISNAFDLHLIPATSIGSIEIIKGASSVLYGSGAATAVVSIQTKEVSINPISGVFTTTIGTNRASEDEDSDLEEFTNYVAVNGTLNKFFYNLNFSNRYVGGLSAVAANPDEPQFDEDVFDRYDGTIKLGYKPNKRFKISRFFGFDKYKAEFDDFSYQDANNLSVSDLKRTGGNMEWKHAKGSITINDNYSWLERTITSSFPAIYDSKSYTFDAFANQKITKQLALLVGVNGNFSSFNSYSIPFGENSFSQDVSEDVAKFNLIDPYVNLVYTSNFGLNLNAGGRMNFHSEYGNHMVYNLNPSYRFELSGTTFKLLGSYSTAYITPSLFQLYDPFYGYEELKPEENRTIEGGMEVSTRSNIRLSVVYFNRDESNFVDFVLVDPDTFQYQYRNTEEEFVSNGVEVELSKRFGTSLNLGVNYTFTQVDERFNARIPKHKLNATLGYSIGKRSFIGIDYQYNGDRQDSFFNPVSFETEDVQLKSYSLVDLTASHRFSKNLKLFAALNNILDTEYEEIYRFQTRGRNFRFGLNLEF